MHEFNKPETQTVSIFHPDNGCVNQQEKPFLNMRVPGASLGEARKNAADEIYFRQSLTKCDQCHDFYRLPMAG